MEALNSVRLESGTAWFGRDYDDKNIPHEAGLENSHISYEKGCYTGQEIIERVRSRGHVNRRLTTLKFLDDRAPALGTKLLIPGSQPATEAGYVTSIGFSPLAGKSIGLGYVRREHSTVGTILDATGVGTEVTSLPQTREKPAL
jgi:folate-binding protein YgfZ